jgi:hypothetical protein
MPSSAIERGPVPRNLHRPEPALTVRPADFRVDAAERLPDGVLSVQSSGIGEPFARTTRVQRQFRGEPVLCALSNPE